MTKLHLSSAESTIPSPMGIPSEMQENTRWLVMVRSAWVILAIILLGLSIAAIPVGYRQAVTPCQSSDCLVFDPVSINRPTIEEVQALAQIGITLDQYALYQISFLIFSNLVSLAVAILLIRNHTENRMALFMSFAFLLWSTFHPPAVYDALPLSWHWLLNLFLAAPYQVAWLLMFYLFPDGRFAPRWVTPIALGRAIQLAAGLNFPNTIFNDLHWSSWLQFGITTFVFCLSIYAQVYKYRRISDPLRRQQTKWVVFAMAGVLVIGFPFLAILSSPPFSQPGLGRVLAYPWFTLVPAGVYLSFGVAILRNRLWDIQVMINHTLVYSGLTAIVIGIYVLIVGLLSLLFREQGSWISSLVATGVIAALFQPLRHKLQSIVNRMMFGQRDDPLAMLNNLTHRLETAGSPEAVLPALVQTVADGLKLPYVALYLPGNPDGWVTAAEVGSKPEQTESLPLMYQKENIGRLVLAPRHPGETFSRAERRLLGTIAQLSSTTLQAVRLMGELRLSRRHIIAGREEERRRIRRDLHDGLGPTLATQILRLENARELLHEDREKAADLILESIQDSKEALVEIRRLVYDLRPPALDELGLLPALREQAKKYAQLDLDISLDLPASLPALQAATEVAVYRIVLEALTNVMRHSQARNCRLRLVLENDGWIILEITDDGRGIAPGQPAGIGLTSMKERTEELGGSCMVESSMQGGTRVFARLPCV